MVAGRIIDIYEILSPISLVGYGEGSGKGWWGAGEESAGSPGTVGSSSGTTQRETERQLHGIEQCCHIQASSCRGWPLGTCAIPVCSLSSVHIILLSSLIPRLLPLCNQEVGEDPGNEAISVNFCARFLPTLNVALKPG